MARPIWTGSINFGLVSIPVELNTAIHEKTVHFHMLTKDGGCRLRRKLVCPETGKEFDFSQTARGIEVAPEEYVLIDQREIDRLKPEKGRALEIVQFVDAGAVDPIYYDRVYYVKPTREAAKAFKLLLTAMENSGKCAIGKFVMRERQYIVVLRPKDEGLVLHTLHYADEVDHMDEEADAGLKKIKLSAGELKMAGELIKSMSGPLHIQEFKDEFRLQLQSLVDAKAKGKEVSFAPDDNGRHEPKVINLMDALKKSLASTPKVEHRHRRSA
jgi:DNA end-binding protein Ku